MVALPSGFSTTLSDPIGILLVLLALVVMPTTELVLPFNVDGHWITPTTPDPTPPTLPPFLSSKLQQLAATSAAGVLGADFFALNDYYGSRHV